jgi:hypothetical protein
MCISYFSNFKTKEEVKKKKRMQYMDAVCLDSDTCSGTYCVQLTTSSISLSQTFLFIKQGVIVSTYNNWADVGLNGIIYAKHFVKFGILTRAQ